MYMQRTHTLKPKNSWTLDSEKCLLSLNTFNSENIDTVKCETSNLLSQNTIEYSSICTEPSLNDYVQVLSTHKVDNCDGIVPISTVPASATLTTTSSSNANSQAIKLYYASFSTHISLSSNSSS